MRGLKIALVVAGCATGAGVAVTGCVVLDSALTVRCIEHDTQTSTLQIPNADTATEFKIDRCKIDREACNDLCALVLEDSAISEALTGCDVSFNGESSITVNAHFDRSTNNPGCSGGGFTGGDDVVNGGGVSGGGTTGLVDAPPFDPPKPIADAFVAPD